MKSLEELVRTHLGISLSAMQMRQFELFESLLLKWNERLNLTAITDKDETRIKHFFDSLSCFEIVQRESQFSVIDIGTGAGFPGIPLKIVNPSLSLTLVETVGKKAEFCRKAVEELSLQSVKVFSTRAEMIGQETEHRESYDWAIARAVAPLSILAEYLLPLVRIGGNALAQKGPRSEDEITNAGKAIQILGGKLHSVHHVILPENMGERTIIQIRKVKQPPPKFPRRAGTPKKNPLGS